MANLKNIIMLVISFSLITTFAACTAKKTITHEEELLPINSIVVLPVEIKISGEDSQTDKVAKSLITGQEVLNDLLSEYFAGRENIRVLTEGQRNNMENNSTRCRTTDAVTICDTYNADAVLICTLHRYAEREGTEYSVIEPASVAFDLKLVMAKTGKTIWSGAFNETQEHMLTNIFRFMEKTKRGFKWITARDLAKEGLEQKFSKCRYLTK
ncbi:MAG: DUF799 domain-containing protein [Desulfobulbaceae bacterium]|nr:DUF799 domain-containing protein [Desulfobulbaceae bacterium]HIJ78729.1 DUF799 family lipoprotein [Deltaproteobacteria bacterium]